MTEAVGRERKGNLFRCELMVVHAIDLILSESGPLRITSPSRFFSSGVFLHCLNASGSGGEYDKRVDKSQKSKMGVFTLQRLPEGGGHRAPRSLANQ